MSNAIEVKDLCRSYRGFCLDHVSFQVESGTIMGFVGQNGAGKTTTIKEMLNIIKRDSGEIRLLGLDNIQDELRIKEQVGVVFDDLYFHPTLNLADVDRIMKGIFRTWSSKQFWQYAEQFELPKRKQFKVYSRGMKMKASMAVALSHEAKLS